MQCLAFCLFLDNYKNTSLISRAILCNDSLVKKLEELERTEFMYNGLIDHTRRMLRAYFDVFLVYKGKLNTVLYEIMIYIKQDGPRSFIKRRKHLDLIFKICRSCESIQFPRLWHCGVVPWQSSKSENRLQ